MSSFFTGAGSRKKRKVSETATANPSASAKRRALAAPSAPPASRRQKQSRPQPSKDADSDSVSGSESDASSIVSASPSAASSATPSDTHETAAERRLKLAEQYLAKIRNEVAGGNDTVEDGTAFDAAEIDRELIAARLKQDVADEQGKLHRFIARRFDWAAAQRTLFRAETRATTGVAICYPHVYTVSKHADLIKWELPKTALHAHTAAASLSTPSETTSSEPAHNLKDGNGKTRAKAKKQPAPARRKPVLLARTRGGALASKTAHHTAGILAVAASSSGQHLVTGGHDRRLIAWDPLTLQPLKIFPHTHRDAITSLAFRGRTHQLFSGSTDRTVKIWMLDELAYVQTLFGHQEGVQGIAAAGGSEERCVSVGGRDRTARLWKVVEESQLVFRGGGGAKTERGDRGAKSDRQDTVGGRRQQDIKTSTALTNATDAPPGNDEPVFHEGSIDSITQPATQYFVTGSDSGTLSLFSLHKKKAVHTLALAHGYDPPPALDNSYAERNPEGLRIARSSRPQPTPRYITALASLPGADVVVSGSWDGFVRVWAISEDAKRLERVAEVDLFPASPQSGEPGETIPSEHSELGEQGKNGVHSERSEHSELSEQGKNGVHGEHGKHGDKTPIVNGQAIRDYQATGNGETPAHSAEHPANIINASTPTPSPSPSVPRHGTNHSSTRVVRGIINSLAVCERPSPSPAPAPSSAPKHTHAPPKSPGGLIIVAGIGDEPRMGRWLQAGTRAPPRGDPDTQPEGRTGKRGGFKGGRNGAVLIEVPWLGGRPDRYGKM